MVPQGRGMPSELVILGFELAFEGSLVAVGVLLLAAFLAFARMNRDVRRARMFIMADRVKRFLGAFTLGFLAIAAESVFSIAGLSPPAAVAAIVIFVFLGSVVYGSLELFLIVHPLRSRWRSPRQAVSRPGESNSGGATSADDPQEVDTHAAR